MISGVLKFVAEETMIKANYAGRGNAQSFRINILTIA
jgi:hypothetical protein